MEEVGPVNPVEGLPVGAVEGTIAVAVGDGVVAVAVVAAAAAAVVVVAAAAVAVVGDVEAYLNSSR